MRAECGGQDAEELVGREAGLREEIANHDGVIDFLKAEVERLKTKCNMQAAILRHLSPERNPDVFFICGVSGQRDENGMPERIEVCPAYGLDWAVVYVRSERTVGPEW